MLNDVRHAADQLSVRRETFNSVAYSRSSVRNQNANLLMHVVSSKNFMKQNLCLRNSWWWMIFCKFAYSELPGVGLWIIVGIWALAHYHAWLRKERRKILWLDENFMHDYNNYIMRQGVWWLDWRDWLSMAWSVEGNDDPMESFE